MIEEPTETSFDALAHELNLSPRWRDVCRMFFMLGKKLEREQGASPMSDSDAMPLQQERRV